MKVKEIIKHLSKFPEDWEIDSIEFKDDKTKLQVSFDTDSLCDKDYGEVKSNSTKVKTKPSHEWDSLKEGDRIRVYNEKSLLIGDFTFVKEEPVNFKTPSGCIVLTDWRGATVRFYGRNGRTFFKKINPDLLIKKKRVWNQIHLSSSN